MRTTLLLITAACLLAAPASAPAQAENLSDEAKLLAGLAEMRLQPVIELMARNPPNNPEEAAALRAAMISGYLPKVANDPDAWRQGIAWVFALQQGMYDNPAYADYYARPMWGADFAQGMLDLLRYRNMAQEFALLGFCSADQRQAVDLIAGKSVEFLQAAEDEFYRLRTVLSRQGDALRDLINSGKWGELEEYTKLQIPYYRAQAIALLATQPDDGPYFARFKDPKAAQAERKRLLLVAAADAKDVLDKATNSGFPDSQVGRILLARSFIAGLQGLHTEAIDLARKGLEYEVDPFTEFQLKLALAKAQTAAGQADAATKLLDELLTTEIATSHPLHLVLIADRQFSIPLAAALKEADPVKRTAMIGQAFGVYQKMTTEMDLGQWKDAVSAYIENRYEDQLASLPGEFVADALPAPLRLAKVKANYNEGMALLQGGDKAAANAKFQQAIVGAAGLLQETKLSDALRAEGMFYRALSHFRKGEAGHAANTFIELADRYPDNPRGQVAIETAYIHLTSKLYAMKPDDDAVVQLHGRAFDVLLNKYPTTDLAKTATYEYAAFLRVQSRYPEAIKWYEKVPTDHPAYIEAQYERLACMGAVWADSRSTADAVSIARDADSFIDKAEPALRQRTGDKLATLRKYVSSALLLKAQVQIESTNQFSQAEQALARVEKEYADVQGTATRIMGLRIRAYQKQGQYDKAEQIIRRFMAADPAQAGVLALSVLQSLNGEIQALVDAKKDPPKVAQLADIAMNLANNLVIPWVDKQASYTPDEKLAIELMPAESLRVAGKYEEALKAYTDLVAKFGQAASTNVEVVQGLAECHFHLKQFNEARKQYTMIIKDRQTQNKYDRLYWNAQMRWHQMWDEGLKGKLDYKLYRSIEFSLRQRRDKDLGGSPFKQELLRLRDKHIAGEKK